MVGRRGRCNPDYQVHATRKPPGGTDFATRFWVRKRISEAVFRRLVQTGLIQLGLMLIWPGLFSFWEGRP
tara:strand:+ start:423 stop:632 length:210 start_codon:yes stop_codon:yes gene_type:complete